MSIDVSLVLNAHREAHYITRTLRSIYDQVIFARHHGLSCELIVVLDDPDPVTEGAFDNWDYGFLTTHTILRIHERSLARARNYGCRTAQGKYVALLDADDLWSYNSLVEKVRTAQHQPRTIILPEYVYAFGDRHFLCRYQTANPRALIDNHPYISQIFAPRALWAELEYAHPDVSRDYAYEDWHFHCESIAKGWNFDSAPSTVLFYRQHARSIMAQSRRLHAYFVQSRSSLFDPEVYFATCNEDAIAPLQRRPNFGVSKTALTAAFWRDTADRKAIQLASEIEPAIDPEKSSKCLMDVAYMPPTAVGDLYLRICEAVRNCAIKSNYTDVILLPSLCVGGGEKYLLQVAEALQSTGQARVLIVATDPHGPHPWQSRVPPGADFLALSDCRIGDTSFDGVAIAVFRLLQSCANDARLHFKPSDFNHLFLRRYGKKLANRLIYYRWCDAEVEFGSARYKAPFVTALLDEMKDNFWRVVSDCEAITIEDQRRTGCPAENYHVLPAYVESAPPEPVYRLKDGFRFRLMWASRLDRQKRPELVVRIAQLLKERAPQVHIDVFAPTHSLFRAKTMFLAAPNVENRPAFSSLGGLPLSEYDGLIYTSFYDGVPNVILEAMSFGLPVIAPSVGGIPEAVRHSETGFLVPHLAEDGAAAEAYVTAILAMYTDFNECRKVSEGAWAYCREKRDRRQHLERVRNIYEL
ncbi:MAG: glycosyltransferase [Pseudomonadota bacterium]